MVTGRTSLTAAGVFADLVLGQGGPLEQFVLPLPGGHGVGHQDQRGGGARGHRGGAHQRLAGTAGEHDDAAAAGPEVLRGQLLVGPELPAGFVEHDEVRCAVHVAGQVLRGPADFEQQLLELAALGGVHHHGFAVDPRPQQGRDLLGADDFLQDRVVVGAHHQAVLRVLLQPQPAVAGHGLFDVDQQRMRHREPGVLQQGVEHLLGVQAGGPGIPEAQRREPVAVHVFRGAFQLGEGGDRVPRLGGLFVVHFQQDGLVTLDDQRSVFTGAVPLRLQHQ